MKKFLGWRGRLENQTCKQKSGSYSIEGRNCPNVSSNGAEKTKYGHYKLLASFCSKFKFPGPSLVGQA